MTDSTQLDHLVAAYQDAAKRLAAGHEVAVEQAWMRTTDMSHLDDFADLISHRSSAARRVSAQLAANFFDAYVAVGTGGDIRETLQVRVKDVDVRSVYAGSVDRAKAIVVTSDIENALIETAPGVGEIADREVTDAARLGTDAANKKHRFSRFVRHPSPNACTYCTDAATRTYGVASLRPLHGHCHCIVLPDLTSAS